MSNANFFIEKGVLKKYQGKKQHVVIPEGVTVIGECAFYNKETIISIEIPNSVTSIEEYAFYNCTGLKELTLPDSVTSIGKGAFYCCKKLERVTLPKSIPHIREYVFKSCECLETIKIPASVCSIGMDAFSYCKALRDIDIPDSVVEIGVWAFKCCPCLADKNGLVIVKGVLCGCYSDAEHIVVPEGVTKIDASAFEQCRGMVELTFPTSFVDFVRGAYPPFSYFAPFERCQELRYVNVPNDLTLPSKILPYNACYRVSDPENFFKTAKPRSIDFVSDSMPMDDEDIAYVWLFQSGKKWKDLVKQRIKNPEKVLLLFAEIYQKNASLPEPKVKLIKEYLDFYADELNATAIHSFLKDICIACPKVKKKLEKEAFFNEYSVVNEKTVHPIEALVDQCYANPTGHREIALKAAKGGVPYADGSGTSSKKAVVVFLEQYMVECVRCSSVTWGKMGDKLDLHNVDAFQQPKEADQIASALDRTALSAFLKKQLQGASYRDFLLSFARWATKKDVEDVLSQIAAKKRGNAKNRYWAQNVIEALYLCDAPAVAAFMEKDKDCNLKRYLSMRGISIQEYRDHHSLPQWPMDESCMIRSAFGRLGYVLNQNLDLRPIELATGKELRSVSAKTDPDAAQEFKTLKNEVTDFYKKRVEYIRSIYITAEKTTVQHWQKTYCSNPILRPVAEKVIWSDAAGATFIVVDGAIRTVDGASYEPKDFVQIAHVLDLTANQIDAWQHYLQNSGKKLLIEQVWEPIAAVNDISLYEHMVLSKEDRNEFKRVLGRKAIAIRSENDYSEFDHRAYKYVYSDTGTMHVGNVLQIRYQVKENTGETTLLEFLCRNKKMTRELNTILLELGRICVKSAIRQDSIHILSKVLSAGYTAAQVAEFIRLAQDCGNTQATAVLLEYQQNHFADLDPMAEFTLD